MGGAIVRPVYVTSRRSWADIVRAGAEPVYWPKRYGYAEWACRVLERWSRRYSFFVDRNAWVPRAARIINRLSGNPGATWRAMPERAALVCGVWVAYDWAVDRRTGEYREFPIKSWHCETCGSPLPPPSPTHDTRTDRPIFFKPDNFKMRCNDSLCVRLSAFLDRDGWKIWRGVDPWRVEPRVGADQVAQYIIWRLRKRASHKRGLGIYPSVFPELRGV